MKLLLTTFLQASLVQENPLLSAHRKHWDVGNAGRIEVFIQTLQWPSDWPTGNTYMSNIILPVETTLHTGDAVKSCATMTTAQQTSITLGDIYRLLMEVLENIADRKHTKALSVRDVMTKTGFGRSHIYALANPKCEAFSDTWPVPFHIGTSTRYWEHEVAEWLEAQSSASRGTHSRTTS